MTRKPLLKTALLINLFTFLIPFNIRTEVFIDFRFRDCIISKLYIMGKIIYALVYLIALVAGVCLLVFNHQAMEETRPVLRYVIMGAGVAFVIPDICFLIASLRPRRDSNGVVVSRPWFSTIMGGYSTGVGHSSLCMPSGFLGNLNISLGVSLIIVSLAQIVWIVKDDASMARLSGSISSRFSPLRQEFDYFYGD